MGRNNFIKGKRKYPFLLLSLLSLTYGTKNRLSRLLFYTELVEHGQIYLYVNLCGCLHMSLSLYGSFYILQCVYI